MTNIHNKFQLAAFTLCLSMAVIVGAVLIGGPLQTFSINLLNTAAPIFVILAISTSGAYVVRLWALWGAEAVKAWRAALWRSDAPSLPYYEPMPDTSTKDDWVMSEQWARQVLIFAFIANQNGFTLRDMLPHVSRSEWENIIELLSTAGVIQAGKRGRGARWANGWNYPRLRAEVKHGLLALPFPDDEPPTVIWEARSKHKLHSHHAQASQVEHDIIA